MLINKANTEILKKRFLDEFQIKPQVRNEDKNGSDGVFVDVDGWVNFNDLKRIKEGVGNTMSLKVENGKIRILVW